jgi:DNA-binding response OmpR family regulator
MEVLAHFRENAPDTIIILLTGNGTLETAVEALRQGAHDYLIKPAKSKEIQASIQRGLEKRQKQLEQRRREVVLSQLEKNLEDSLNKLRGSENNPVRRLNGDKGSVENQNADKPGDTNPVKVESGADGRFLAWEKIKVDLLRRQITVDGFSLDLSPTEYDLFLYLIKEAPRIVGSKELVRQILGYEIDQDEASGVIRTHIYRLRQKIKVVVPEKNIIQTARGVGYAVDN